MSEIDRAVKILREGGLVAFPTETVYGLGADATNTNAVRKVFDVKGRPPTNPVIVHVADATVALRFAREWPEPAEKLAQRFWPGPLTLVVPKNDSIVPKVTAGLDSVGLRAPDHPVALELLRAFDGPVAAPSANRSSHVSPTTAQHVRDELGDDVDVMLDGGPCEVGIESTVLDLTCSVPTILRPGAVTLQQIRDVIGTAELKASIIEANMPARSPGQHEKHYAPRTPAFRFEPGQGGTARVERAGLIVLGAALNVGGHSIMLPRDPSEYARHFYRVLRELDANNLDAIYIELPPDTPEWAAVRDRLMRATRPLDV